MYGSQNTCLTLYSWFKCQSKEASFVGIFNKYWAATARHQLSRTFSQLISASKTLMPEGNVAYTSVNLFCEWKNGCSWLDKDLLYSLTLLKALWTMPFRVSMNSWEFLEREQDRKLGTGPVNDQRNVVSVCVHPSCTVCVAKRQLVWNNECLLCATFLTMSYQTRWMGLPSYLWYFH